MPNFTDYFPTVDAGLAIGEKACQEWCKKYGITYNEPTIKGKFSFLAEDGELAATIYIKDGLNAFKDEVE